MFDDFDKKLNSLLEKKEIKKETMKEKKNYNFEGEIEEKLEDSDAILIFKKEDGSLGISESKLINRDLLISIMANAILLVLLLTKIGRLW